MPHDKDVEAAFRAGWVAGHDFTKSENEAWEEYDKTRVPKHLRATSSEDATIGPQKFE